MDFGSLLKVNAHKGWDWFPSLPLGRQGHLQCSDEHTCGRLLFTTRVKPQARVGRVTVYAHKSFHKVSASREATPRASMSQKW